MAVFTHDEYSAVFYWKVESLEEYLYCILNALIQPEDDDKGPKPDLIVYDGGNMTLLIHEFKDAEEFFLMDGTIPDPSSTENVEFNIIQTIVKCQLEGRETYKWNKIVNACMGFS